MSTKRIVLTLTGDTTAMTRALTPSRMRDAVIREVRRFSVYECPTHGIIDQFHVGIDKQCPVATKGIGCTEELFGPFVVEEID